jgi:HemY protein
MKKLVFYFIVLLIAVWAGLKIASDPGYLLVAYQKVTVEMPLWLAVLGILGLFFVLYFLLRIIINIRSLGAKIRAWSRVRRVRRAWQRTHRGLIALSAGEFKIAEKDLVRAAPYTDTPLLNYLGAARAAQSQRAMDRRDEYLGKISAKGKLNELACGLAQAEMQYQSHQYEQALATLQQLQQIAPKHKPLLSLLKEIYLKLEDWGPLEILLPQLERSDSLSILVYKGLLKSANGSENLVWNRVPKHLRLSPVLLAAYVPLIAKNKPDDAEALLRESLEKTLDDTLLSQYSLLDSTRKEKQLKVLETFLKTTPKHPMLLLALGRLCVKNELWGKARSYFEASLGLAAKPETYQALGELLEKLGEMEKAMLCYRQGLMLRGEVR